jgi:hypothetical protein
LANSRRFDASLLYLGEDITDAMAFSFALSRSGDGEILFAGLLVAGLPAVFWAFLALAFAAACFMAGDHGGGGGLGPRGAVAAGFRGLAAVAFARAGAAAFAAGFLPPLALPDAFPLPPEENRPRLSLVYVRPACPFAMTCYLLP